MAYFWVVHKHTVAIPHIAKFCYADHNILRTRHVMHLKRLVNNNCTLHRPLISQNSQQIHSSVVHSVVGWLYPAMTRFLTEMGNSKYLTNGATNLVLNCRQELRTIDQKWLRNYYMNMCMAEQFLLKSARGISCHFLPSGISMSAFALLRKFHSFLSIAKSTKSILVIVWSKLLYYMLLFVSTDSDIHSTTQVTLLMLC